MGILDKAKEHFEAIETKNLHVPEWDITVHWRPWNLNERQRVFGAVQASGKQQELSARVLIAKAVDKDLKALFNLGDLRALTLEVESAIVDRIAVAIIGEPGAGIDFYNTEALS